MSATLTSTNGTRRAHKSTCRKCNRTVIVLDIAGAKAETDPELINVIPFDDGATRFVLARRVHADNCVRYQSEASRIKMKAEAKRALRKPRNGKREPGQ